MLPYLEPQLTEEPPAIGFASRSEEVVFWELKRRGVPFTYQWFPGGDGDIVFTPDRENRSADFAIHVLKLIINPTSAFTHPSKEADQYNRWLFFLLGYEQVFIDEGELLEELGGNVSNALDYYCPQLRFVGQIAHQRNDYDRQYRRYHQPTYTRIPR